jgi:Protein of unknown function (DUF3761)
MNTTLKKSGIIFIGLFLSLSPVFATTGYYTNSNGARVQSPVSSYTVPKGASAQCKDGTYSFSKHRSGTCSGHKGVKKWY